MSRKTFKFIQINIYKGKYLIDLLEFLKREEPDFVSAQEVTSGEQNLSEDKRSKLFDLIKKELGFNGFFQKSFEIRENGGIEGLAVFSKFPVLACKSLALKEFAIISKGQINDPAFFPEIPRYCIDALCNFEGQKIHVLSWHGAWTAPPTDTDETLRQAKIVADYLKSLREPFVMGGDLNAVLESRTVETINKVAVNLMEGSGILQTMHPKVHKIAPRGYLVDYVFCSPDISRLSLQVPQVLVSDHMPVVASFRI